MISRLTGKIVLIDQKHIVLDVGGVGYKVGTTSDIVQKLKKEEENITLWTYLAVRENAMDLYGFLSISELNFFELLITISGIGPKTALGILNIASVHALETAIQTRDTSHLIKVSGLGKKVAEKIVMELKDKVGALDSSKMTVEMSSNMDVIEALKALGYDAEEARDALKKIGNDVTSTNSKIKEALKILGK